MKAIKPRLQNLVLKNSTDKKLLGVKFDSNLSFENHVTCLSKKAREKLHAFTRISHYMDLNRRKNLITAFITSHFTY